LFISFFIYNHILTIIFRFINIAEEADAISKPYEIKPLNAEDSKQLLLKKIFPNQNAKECPKDLLPLAPELAKKCGGWPLALVVLGGILSRKIPNYITWDEVIRNMDWHTDGSRCMCVISSSYDYLPIHLKPCFMYFAVFPEDRQIKATTLIHLWIAEGFIFPDASKTMEGIAENYLEELAQRYHFF
jgi:NB-ARC domain